MGVGMIIGALAVVVGVVVAFLIMRSYPLNQGKFTDIVAGFFITVVMFGMVMLSASYIALLTGVK